MAFRLNRQDEKAKLFILIAILFAVFFLVLLLVGRYEVSTQNDLATLRLELRVLREEFNALRESIKLGRFADQPGGSSSEDGEEDDEDNLPDTAMFNFLDRSQSAGGREKREEKKKNNKEQGHSPVGKHQDGGRRQPSGQKTKKRKSRKIVAAQLEGTSNYANPGPGGIFKHWHFAHWVDEKDKLFTLGGRKPNKGKVTIHKNGIYFIYAQITYIGLTDQQFLIVRESKDGTNTTLACCIKATHSSAAGEPAISSCHTSGIFPIKKNDKVYIKDYYGLTPAKFEQTRSFFGFFKLL